MENIEKLEIPTIEFIETVTLLATGSCAGNKEQLDSEGNPVVGTIDM